jgi:hypothetical protein
MRITIYVFSIAVLLILGFGSCNIINPSETTPTYVQIDSFTFSGVQRGSSSHKITNVWVYFNNTPVGNFDLPAKFPVIVNAPGTLLVAPGIDYDGLISQELVYPLYTGDTMHLSPAPGTVVSFKPKTGYLPSSDLKFEETFESNPILFSRYSGDTGIVRTYAAGEVYEGGASGAIYITPNQDSAVVVSSDIAKAITPGADAYIELDYKGTLTLRVGMYAMSNTTGEVVTKQLIGIKPRNEWGKFYIDIKNFIGTHQDATYKVLIRADRGDIPKTSGGSLFIDNIKVVSF